MTVIDKYMCHFEFYIGIMVIVTFNMFLCCTVIRLLDFK